MGILSWVIFGAIAGWIATRFIRPSGVDGCLTNIAVGIVGSLVGGGLYSAIKGRSFDYHWSVGSFLLAVMGALLFLWVVNLFQQRR